MKYKWLLQPLYLKYAIFIYKTFCQIAYDAEIDKPRVSGWTIERDLHLLYFILSYAPSDPLIFQYKYYHLLTIKYFILFFDAYIYSNAFRII